MCGLRNQSIQKRLLSEADLTLAKAAETDQGMEAAEKNAKKFQEVSRRRVSTSLQDGPAERETQPYFAQ